MTVPPAFARALCAASARRQPGSPAAALSWRRRYTIEAALRRSPNAQPPRACVRAYVYRTGLRIGAWRPRAVMAAMPRRMLSVRAAPAARRLCSRARPRRLSHCAVCAPRVGIGALTDSLTDSCKARPAACPPPAQSPWSCRPTTQRLVRRYSAVHMPPPPIIMIHQTDSDAKK